MRENDVLAGFRHLEAIAPQGCDELLSYKDETYINGPFQLVPQVQGGNLQQVFRRIPPRFPPNTWNVHNQVIDNDPKTNNLVEGWNNRFKNLVGHVHPSIWRAINYLKLERKVAVAKISRYAAGIVPYHYAKMEYQRSQENIRNLCIRYRDGEIGIPEFLRGVGHNIHHGQD